MAESPQSDSMQLADWFKFHPKVSVPAVGALAVMVLANHFGVTLTPLEMALLSAAFGYAAPGDS